VIFPVDMRIEALKIKNFKVFKDVQVSNLPPMCVFLGVNGSGKSTLFDVFSFLADALRDNVTVALNRRGGFREVLSRGCDPEKDSIEIEFKFKMSYEPFLSIIYFVEIGLISGTVSVRNERVYIHHLGTESQTEHFNFSKGNGFIVIDDDKFNLDLRDANILAVKALSFFKDDIYPRAIVHYLSSLFVADFNTDVLRLPSVTNGYTFLLSDGSNLANVTKDLYDNQRADFDKILAKLPKHIPAIQHVEAQKSEDGRIILKFQDKHFKDPFDTQSVSDGTMKFFAYLVLLSGYHPNRLLCLEEPEKDFHPQIMPYLVEEIRQNAEQRSGQVFVSTHSPEFVDAVQLDELFYMVKQDGFSTIRAAADDPVVRELAKDNSLGWLWRNNYLQTNSL
jgi:predicted ATPase